MVMNDGELPQYHEHGCCSLLSFSQIRLHHNRSHTTQECVSDCLVPNRAQAKQRSACRRTSKPPRNSDVITGVCESNCAQVLPCATP
jgi:hypothetical protein